MHIVVRIIIALILFGASFTLISFAVALAAVLIGDDLTGIGVADDPLLIICIPIVLAGVAAFGAGVAVLKGGSNE